MENTRRNGKIFGSLFNCYRWIENIETNLKYSVEVFSVENLIEELLIWHGTFRDAPDNFDAQLLKKAAIVLQQQWDRIGELEDMLD